MFARGRQAVSEEELNRDLSTLLPGDSEQSTGEDVALSPAQRATGWFFFIYKSEARSRDSRMRSYEFLHSTFAEFLVARLAVSAMQDLAAVREATRSSMTAVATRIDDGFPFCRTIICLPGGTWRDRRIP